MPLSQRKPLSDEEARESYASRRHHTWTTSELKTIRWSSLLLRDAAAWALTAMVVTGALAVAIDIPLLLLDGSGLAIALATGIFASGLAAGLAAPLALLLAALAAVVRWIWLRFGRRWAALAPVVLVSLPVGWILAMPPDTKHFYARMTMIVAFTLVMMAIVAAGRSRKATLRWFGAVLLGGIALAVDLAVPKSFYREVHDLTCLITIMAGLVAMRPLQRRAAEVPSIRLVAVLAAGLGLAITLMTAVDQIAPGWRRESVARSRYATRLLSLTRAMVDFDADGFSPIMWGGDCDDFNDRLHPLARDPPGGPDRNCNGIVAPKHPTDSMRGLAPAHGDPDLGTGGADLVLLITVDCLRADVFKSAMPRVNEHAQRGVVFERMYSGGTRTSASMSLIATGGTDGTLLGRRLHAAGINSTLVLGVNYPTLIDSITPGVDQVIVDHDKMWITAVEVNAKAVAHLNKVTSEPGRHFVWVHYFDAHAPSAEALPPTTEAGARAAREYYTGGLHQVDQEIGEMLDGLARRGALERAVVIVTADHGEAFGEHGLFFHNVSGYETLSHVPAMMIAPGLAPGHFTGLTSHRDVYATVLGAFGLVRGDSSIERTGRSWLRLRAAPNKPLHDFVTVRTHRFTSGPVAFSPMMVLVQSHYKLVKALDEDKLFELYDLDADPREAVDLAWMQIGLRDNMEHDLDLFRDIDRWP